MGGAPQLGHTLGIKPPLAAAALGASWAPARDEPLGREPLVLSQDPRAHLPPYTIPQWAPQLGTDGRGRVSMHHRTSRGRAEVTLSGLWQLTPQAPSPKANPKPAGRQEGWVLGRTGEFGEPGVGARGLGLGSPGQRVTVGPGVWRVPETGPIQVGGRLRWAEDCPAPAA